MSVVNLRIQVDDLPSTLQLYNKIQVWRSVNGSDGTYVEITSDSPSPAELVASLSGPYALSGKTLSIVINGADPTVVVFAGPDPVPLTLVVDELNLASPGIAGLTTSNHLQLTSPLPGTGSSLAVTGNAAAVLGLPSSASGTGARILMGNINTIYMFTDLAGAQTYYYKTRFYSSVTRAVSTFSSPMQGLPGVILPSDVLVLCSINLVNALGEPVVGRRVILVPTEAELIKNHLTDTSYGMLPGADRITLTTDGAGHAEARLIVGATFRAFFEGSGYSREFVVPADPFDLLTVLSTKPDPFSIVQAPPFSIRES